MLSQCLRIMSTHIQLFFYKLPIIIVLSRFLQNKVWTWNIGILKFFKKKMSWVLMGFISYSRIFLLNNWKTLSCSYEPNSDVHDNTLSVIIFLMPLSLRPDEREFISNLKFLISQYICFENEFTEERYGTVIVGEGKIGSS
jgi:hypothetical protein